MSLINKSISNYKIVSVIGHGGMSIIYKAIKESYEDDNTFAIKVLNQNYTYNKNLRERFINEGNELKKISCRNIVKVFEVIENDDFCGIVMELLEGENLLSYTLNNSPLSNKSIDHFFAQAVRSISHIHQKGLIHRDIKPSNFFVEKNNRLKLLDFGIVKDLNTDYTIGNQILGTPRYMSPEQFNSKSDVTKQSDIYSLGMVLYFMIENSTPFDDIDYFKIKKIKTKSNFIGYKNIFKTSRLNNYWGTIIKKSTAKKIKDRYNDIEDLKKDLNQTVIDPYIENRKLKFIRNNKNKFLFFSLLLLTLSVLLIFKSFDKNEMEVIKINFISDVPIVKGKDSKLPKEIKTFARVFNVKNQDKYFLPLLLFKRLDLDSVDTIKFSESINSISSKTKAERFYNAEKELIKPTVLMYTISKVESEKIALNESANCFYLDKSGSDKFKSDSLYFFNEDSLVNYITNRLSKNNLFNTNKKEIYIKLRYKLIAKSPSPKPLTPPATPPVTPPRNTPTTKQKVLLDVNDPNFIANFCESFLLEEEIEDLDEKIHLLSKFINGVSFNKENIHFSSICSIKTKLINKFNELGLYDSKSKLNKLCP